MRSVAGALWALAFLIPMIAIASPEESEPYHRYYYKEKISMIADTESIAVYDPGRERPADLKRLFVDAGYPGAEFRKFLDRGWTIALIRSASATPRISSVAPIISRLVGLDRSSRYFFSPVFANKSGEPLLISPTILIRFERGVSDKRIRQILDSAGVRPAQATPFGGMQNSFRITTGDRSGIRILEIANRLAEYPEVTYAEPNMVMTGRTAAVPNDPLFVDSWGLHNTGQYPGAVVDIDIDAPDAWDETTGDPSIIVVVIDVGVQQDHPDINQLPGSDHTGIHSTPAGDGGPSECDHHGTPVAGVISGIANNSIGTSGVAPNVRVMSARAGVTGLKCVNVVILECTWLVDALTWAESVGARITNNSYYLDDSCSCLSDKFQETYNKGIVHFAGAGNDPQEPVAYPANLPLVNAVSSIDWNGQLSSFSSFGPELSFSAPGSQIQTTDRTGLPGWDPGNYVILDGTSFASPMAAGVAALILSVNPTMTAPEVEGLMQSTVVDLGAPGPDNLYGWGLVNAGNAISPLIFGDGFETGTTVRWSITVQ